MDTEKKLGIKKGQALSLFLQMILSIIILATSIYLLVFVIVNKVDYLGWMITSYVLINLSILAIIVYGIIGFKKGRLAYYSAIVPFLGAILVNILLPTRSVFQIALLAVLFALNVAFLLRQDDRKFTYIILGCSLVVALTFSIYSAITANTQFLGPVSEQWFTYLAMYLSIFIPTIMETTFAITYNVRTTRKAK